MLRAEASVAALKNAGEEVGDSLLIAMILKGLPPKFKAFNTVITQKASNQHIQNLKYPYEHLKKMRNPRRKTT